MIEVPPSDFTAKTRYQAASSMDTCSRELNMNLSVLQDMWLKRKTIIFMVVVALWSYANCSEMCLDKAKAAKGVLFLIASAIAEITTSADKKPLCIIGPIKSSKSIKTFLFSSMVAAHDPVVGMAALLVFWLVGPVLHLHVS